MDSCILRILLLYSLCGWTLCFDYCSLTCDESGVVHKHTMCEFQKSPGPKCEGYKEQSLTESEKTSIVKKHNEFRRKVAKGEETRGKFGPQPKASNMMELVWDEELAEIAQRWSDQCEVGHDKCRRVERFSVGQNYASLSTSGPNFLNSLDTLVQMWYDEVNDVKPDTITRFPGTSEGVVGHYTQLVWAKTMYVGCGRTFHVSATIKMTALICNYGPAGNILGTGVYLQGEPCSDCKDTGCSDGLCSRAPTSCRPQSWLLLSILVSVIVSLVTIHFGLA